MTGEGDCRLQIVDWGLRIAWGCLLGLWFGWTWEGWIPAFAGMTEEGAGMTWECAGYDVGDEGRTWEGWIPAFAGMTKGVREWRGWVRDMTWVGAGMTEEGAGMTWEGAGMMCLARARTSFRRIWPHSVGLCRFLPRARGGELSIVDCGLMIGDCMGVSHWVVVWTGAFGFVIGSW